MKWVDGYTLLEEMERKQKYLGSWHTWFAWYPVTIGFTRDKRQIKVWLKKVNRKGTYHQTYDDWWWTWEYKELE